MQPNWTQGLNAEQAEAVAHTYGPLLILAGAGSGKTTVLVARAGRMITDGSVRPRDLCVLTFTNKAARELKTRVQAKLGPVASGIWAGTFHSFGLHLLRKYRREAGLSDGFGIMDATDAGSLAKELLRDFDYGGKTAYDAQKLLAIISEWRENGKTQASGDDEYEVAVEWLLPRFLKRLTMLGMVDFDGLILKPTEMMEQIPSLREEIQNSFTQVMVDEFQDTNRMQMRFIRQLVDSHKNITVVGDDDQSIYGWRGACISNILDFPKTYSQCKVVRLERNYRSTPAILALANSIIAKNTQRHTKVLRSREDSEHGDLPEVFVYADENEEAESVAGEVDEFIRQGYAKKEIAVLYRSNGQGALLEAELRRKQVPYLMSGGTAFFDRKETRDIIAYLRCAIKPNEVALRRIINTPPRGIGEKTVELITEHAAAQKIKFPEAVKEWRAAGVEERAGAAIEVLLQQLSGMTEFVLDEPTVPCGQRILQFFNELGYQEYLRTHSTNAQVAAKRLRYIEVFSNIVDRFVDKTGRTAQTLKQFIDAMELRDVLNDKEENEDRVQLLTLHACKGLEFPSVILMGVEEDILPHKMLGNDLSEERRLFYVGVTRAQKKLILTRASNRRRHGKTVPSPPSRFLLEIPSGLTVEHTRSRPIQEEKRKSMIADLFKKLDALGSR